MNGEACNHMCAFPANLALFPDILEAHGYNVGYTGKGWAPGDLSKLKRNPCGNEYNKRFLTPPPDSQISHCDYAANFKDFLSECDGKPFYFWYGGYEPHRKYNFGEGLKNGKTLDEIQSVPSYWPDTETVRTDMLDYAFEIEWFDKQLAKMVEELKKADKLKDTLIIVTGDNGCPFPRVKGQMYEQDFHLPLIAYYEGMKVRGRRVGDIVNFVDIAPTVLEAAGIEKHPDMVGRSFFDTIVSEKSGQISDARKETYFGREKQDVGSEDDLGYPVRCIRNGQYLYIYNFAPDRWPAGNPETYFTNCDSSPTKDLIIEFNDKGDGKYYDLAFGKRPREELYDILKDGECIFNLAGRDGYKKTASLMRKKLFDFLKKTNDPRLNDENYFERMKLISDGESYSWKAYKEGRWKKQPY